MEYASKGVAGTALGFGIAGTALALSRNNNNCGNNGGLLSGLFGGNNNDCCNVSKDEFHAVNHANKEIAALEAKLAACTAERYADGVGISAYKDMVAYVNGQIDKTNSVLREVTNETIAQGQSIASMKSDLRGLNDKVDYENLALNTRITTVKDSTDTSIATMGKFLSNEIECEREKRIAADERIITYVDGNFIRADKYLSGRHVFCPDSSICGDSTTATKK